MRDGLRILTRNNFAGQINPTRIFAGQCGAGWPALPPLDYIIQNTIMNYVIQNMEVAQEERMEVQEKTVSHLWSKTKQSNRIKTLTKAMG